MNNEAIITKRTCDAVLIPIGTPISIPAGSAVTITQALGGSYTVNINGNLARIAPKDADALGFESSIEPECPQQTRTDGVVDEECIWEQLRTCYDPEIPVNIVDLGLVYKCDIHTREGRNHVNIIMTLTAPGCGMGDFLAEDARQKVAQVPNVDSVHVELSFDPPWSQEMMSEAARLATGLY
ncbi:MAG: putative Fe-S cluster assembly protein SufT [Candidatus Eutrophobiaceae bacterium]